jgi:hypothetical protein
MDTLIKVRPKHALALTSSYAQLIDTIIKRIQEEFKTVDVAVLKRDISNVVLFVMELIEFAVSEKLISKKAAKKLNKSQLCMDILKQLFQSFTEDDTKLWENQLLFILDSKLSKKSTLKKTFDCVWRLLKR